MEGDLGDEEIYEQERLLRQGNLTSVRTTTVREKLQRKETVTSPKDEKERIREQIELTKREREEYQTKQLEEIRQLREQMEQEHRQHSAEVERLLKSVDVARANFLATVEEVENMPISKDEVIAKVIDRVKQMDAVKGAKNPKIEVRSLKGL